MAILNNLTRFPLSNLPAGSVSPFSVTGVEVDFAIGGIPFMSAAHPDHPYQRGTAPYRKDQFDTSIDPGEQSIVTWWLRSQSSFHGGAGLDYEVPHRTVTGITAETKFSSSAGVDPWTPGKVKLLKRTTNPHSGGSNLKLVEAVDVNGVDCYLQSDGANLYRIDASGTATALTWGGSNTILSLAFDGQNFYAADSVGIWKGTVPNTGAVTGGTKIWNTGSTPVTIAFVKQRLVAGIGPAIYELVGTGPALPTASYTHPAAGWKWTGFTEGPAAIYAAGYAGPQSTILKLSLSTTGAVPTLTSATVAADLPRGEYATSILGYLGTFLIIGTSRGVRVSTISDNGQVNEGALSLPLSSPVYGLTAKDRFVWATATNAIDGKSGLYRLDLSNQDSDTGFFPYASDLQTHVTGTCSAVAQLGTSGRLVIAVDGGGSYLESATLLETTGTLTTERIRFATLDEKLFKFLQLRALTPLAGTVSISQVSELGTTRSLITFDKNSAISEVSVAGDLGPQEFMSFTFTLTADVAGTSGPELHGYQLKALPAAKRQRQYIIPLLCFDTELDRNGVKWGYDGFHYERLSALEELEEAGDVVLFQDLSRNETRLCVIDQIQHTEAAPMSGASGHGGYLVVQLRAVT